MPFIDDNKLAHCKRVRQKITVLGALLCNSDSSADSNKDSSSTLIDGFTIYLILDQPGCNPIRVTSFIARQCSTHLNVSWVEVAVNASTLI